MSQEDGDNNEGNDPDRMTPENFLERVYDFNWSHVGWDWIEMIVQEVLKRELWIEVLEDILEHLQRGNQGIYELRGPPLSWVLIACQRERHNLITRAIRYYYS